VSIRAAFVYANPRTALAQDVAAGRAPDTGLLGQNHLAPLGIDAAVHDPALTRRRVLPFRVAWNLRELTLPWELRSADVVCTPLANLFPLAARGFRTTRPVVVNMGLCARLARSSGAQRRIVRASLASASAIVCFASAQRERLLEQTGLPEDRVRVALFGVDERFYAPSPPPSDGYVLAAGRDLARDYATFARAVDGLDVPAIVVASARNLTDVQLPANVRVHLDVPYDELRRLYAGASCVVVPTRSESHPYGADCSGHTVLLEAMASGRPTVLSARATNSEYVAGAEAATEVPPEDPAALRAAIEELLSDDRRAAVMGSAGRDAVEESFTTRHLAKRLAPILREAAEGSR
jgi:glycosyltransferase involved in cell wall biosynthesis